jgi:hypothetical protein
VNEEYIDKVKSLIEQKEADQEMEDNAAVQGQWGVLDPILHKRRNCYIKSIK